MKKILVPTDFSKNALKAVGYASEIARKSNASVILMHVIEPEINFVTMQSDSKNKTKLKKNSTELLLLLKSIVEIYPGINIIPHLAGGPVIATILDFAEEENVDMIVMGTKGATGFKEFFIGSITAGTISKTNIPILSVPASYELEQPDVILFATNQFEKNKKLLDKVFTLPKLFGSAVHVVVLKEKDGDVNADLIYNEEQVIDYVSFLKEMFPEIQFTGILLEGENFENTIDKYNNQHDGDMITMVTYPKSFSEKIFRKSVTKKMAYHSTTPVLAIPALF